MEIVQPEFRMPHRSDPLAWELTPVVHSKWAEHILAQIGFSHDEIRRYQLGSVIDHFLYDDGNVFAILNFRNENQLVASGMQRQLLTRLDWETSLGVLPQDIQNELTAIKELVSVQDWQDWDQVLDAHCPWRELKASVEKRIQKGGDLNRVYTDYQRLNNVLSPLWQDFLVLSGYRV